MPDKNSAGGDSPAYRFLVIARTAFFVVLALWLLVMAGSKMFPAKASAALTLPVHALTR